VLDDPVLRQRFESATRDAISALDRLADKRVPSNLAADWRKAQVFIEDQLRGPVAEIRTREAAVTEAFASWRASTPPLPSRCAWPPKRATRC
jgi:hypothetical protein